MEIENISGQLSNNACVYSHELQILITVFGTTIVVINTKTQEKIIHFNCHQEQILDLKLINSNGKFIIYSIDCSGLICKIDLERKKLISSQNLQINESTKIASAALKSNSYGIYFCVQKQQTECLYYSDLTAKEIKLNEFFSHKKQIVSHNPLGKSLQLSACEQFLVWISEKTIFIFGTESKQVVKKLNHFSEITVFAIHPLLHSIALGNLLGKITYYYNPFATNAEKVKTKTVHWHSQKVNCLAFFQNGDILLSGGTEGVLVYWQQTDNKCNFCPRLGSSLLHLQAIMNDNATLLMLEDNSIVFLQNHDYQKLFRYNGITNCKKFLPIENVSIAQWKQDSNFGVMQSTQGNIQLIDFEKQVKVNELSIIPTNFTQNQQNNEKMIIISKICFDSNGKYLVLACQQSQSYGNEIQVSNLQFWAQQQDFEYYLQSKFENPHLNLINQISTFQQNSNLDEKFITFGEDNKFKIWKQYTRKIQQQKLKVQTEEKIQEYWNCEYENNYKNLKINALCINNNNKLFICCASILVIWNLENLEIQEVFEISLNPQLIKLQPLINNQIAIYNEQQFQLFNQATNQFSEKLNLNKIIKIQSSEKEKLQILLKKEFQNGQTFSIIMEVNSNSLKIEKIKFLQYELETIYNISNNNFIGITEDFSWIWLNQPVHQRGKKLQMPKKLIEITNKEQINQECKFQKQYEQYLNSKQIKALEFSQQSHLLPQISLIYQQYEKQLLDSYSNSQFLQESIFH